MRIDNEKTFSDAEWEALSHTNPLGKRMPRGSKSPFADFPGEFINQEVELLPSGSNVPGGDCIIFQTRLFTYPSGYHGVSVACWVRYREVCEYLNVTARKCGNRPLFGSYGRGGTIKIYKIL